MKKLMCAIAAVSAGICMADVQSANVVGYTTTQTMKAGMWYIIGSNFESVGGGSVRICDFLKNADLTAGSMTSDSATIQLRVNGVPVDYFYNQWYWDMNAGGFVPSWTTTMSQKPTAEERIAPGVGFWMKNPSATPVEVEFFLEKKPTAE